MVVSATAYQRLDEETRVGRIDESLRSNGMVAIIDTVHLDSEYDNFPKASQKCYSQWDEKSNGDYHHPTLKEATETGFKRKNEFSGIFKTALDSSYTRNVRFDSGTYVKLLQTYSNVITMPEAKKEGFSQLHRQFY